MPPWLRIPTFLRSRKSRIIEFDRNFRQKMLAVMPETVVHVPCEPSICAELNLNELEGLTSKINELGFEHCADRRSRWPGETKDRGFQRVLANQRESCFAVIYSTSKRMENHDNLLVTFYCALEQDWWVGATNSKPSTFKYMIRSPKHPLIWKPSATAAELYSNCLELTGKIAGDLGIRKILDISLSTLDDWSPRHLKEVRALIGSRSALREAGASKKALAGGDWVWLGDYANSNVGTRE